MNFVAQLEDYLRDLGSEARKKHPGVKEASERAILKLRTLQNAYVIAVRKASNTGTGHPDTKLFRSSDLLHPFLLAANYPNASPKLLDTSFKAMKTLMEANAICPGDGRNMVRVWMIQAQVVVSYSSVSTTTSSSSGASKDTKGSSSVSATASTGTMSAVPSNVKSIGTEQSSSSSSWFGSLLSSASSSTSSSTTTYSVTNNKTAVSSSHGKGASHLTPKDLEKLGLDILSCLLQLLELRDLPVSPEQWTQSITLCCLLYLPGLPIPVKRFATSGGIVVPLYQHSTVRQAAHSTLPQVLSLLLSISSSASPSSAIEAETSENAPSAEEIEESQRQQRALAVTTWNDLVTCILAGVINPQLLEEKNTFHGAFAQCRLPAADSPPSMQDIAQPPSVALSLELLTTLLKEEQRHVTSVASTVGTADDKQQSQQEGKGNLFDEVASNTFTVIDQVLQALGSPAKTTRSSASQQNPLEFVRLLQLVLVLLQTKASKFPDECRNLVSRLIPPIPAATAALRRHADFEDGHIFQRPPSIVSSGGTGSVSSTASSSSNIGSASIGTTSAAGGGPTATSSAAPTYDTLRGLPPTVLWKASLCIDLVQQIVQDTNLVDLWKHSESIVPLFESMSDFCTIGASCQDHMALVVASAHRMPKSSTLRSSLPGMMASPQPGDESSSASAGLFHVAETLAASSGITTSNSFYTNNYGHPNSRGNGATNASTSSSSNNSPGTPISYYPLLDWWRLGKGRENYFILGDALWIGLNSVLTMIDGLDPDALEQVFAPCLAVLQHYLKRFPASGAIVQRSLTGYYKLSKIAMRSDPLLRRALLSSLCKLAMPTPIPRVASTGGDEAPVSGNDSTSRALLLRDHNVAALICLINLIHRQFNSIGSEWSIVMQTFQELSILPISSPDLSDNAYVDALSISAVYGRFAAFSTCLGDESVCNFAQGLAELAPVVEMQQQPYLVFQQIQQQQSSKGDRAATAANKDDTNNPSIGAKLMNIGVRAIYGSQDGSSSDDDVPLAQRTRNTYAHEFQKEFRLRMNRSKHPIRGLDGFVGSGNASTSVSSTRPHQEAPLPFALELLADVAMSNSFRIGRCNVSKQLCSWAGETESPSARLFAMDTVAMLILSHIADPDEYGKSGIPTGFPASFIGPGTIMYRNPRRNQYLAVEKIKDETQDEDRITPFLVPHADLLRPLCEFIQTVKEATAAEAGLETLHTVLESAGHKLSGGDVWAVVIDAVASFSSPERSKSDWAPSCLLGFRCLKLIVDDFIDLALMDGSASSRSSLLDCCFAFGCSRHDVNTSLTAIGLLWKIADQNSGGDGASIDDPVQLALSKLVLLSSDDRAEVRNCAVNTLVSCVVGRGQGFSADQWKTCICDMVFGVYDMVSARGEGGDIVNTPSKPSSPQSGRKRYKVNIHHSRDSADKQWVATQSLVLRGLCRILRLFFSDLLDTTSQNDPVKTASGNDDTPWFDDAWNRVLGYAFDASTQVGGRDTLELRSAGVELLVLCNQLACRAGIQAALSPARVGTNMEVVNGALRSVRSPAATSRKKLTRQETSSVTELWRENLFLDAFDVLDSFREHLESDTAVDHESGLSPFLEPTQVQVLSKFAENLSKLYECCKNDEFMEDLPSSVGHLEHYLGLSSGDRAEADSLVFRFVRIIVTVAEKSSGGPEARFLSQAERSCVDLLRSMASDGSAEAFMNLTSMAGLAFFSLEKTAQSNIKYGIDAQSHEAAKIVCEEVCNVGVSKECKIVVGCRILSDYLDEEGQAEAFSLKLIAPLVIEAMKAASTVESPASSESGEQRGSLLDKLIDALWQRVSEFLSRLIKPGLTSEASGRTIAHALDLVDIVQASAAQVPSRHHEMLCTVLSSGASSCLKLAKENGKETKKDKDKRQQEQHLKSENELKLFTTCFVGVCSVQPTDQRILSLADEILADTSESLKARDDQECEQGVGIRSTLSVFRALQEMVGIEPFLVAIFPKLCKLIGTEHTALRMAVGNVIGRINVGEVLEETQARCRDAVERAEGAEARAIALEALVEELKRQKEELERQVAVLTATAAM